MTGAFHSTKTFENFETAAIGTEMSRKSFQKFRKLLNFRNANHSTENSRNFGNKVEWKENFGENIFENLGIPCEVILFFGNFREYCSIRNWKLPKIESGRFGWMESARRLGNKRSNCRAFWWRVTIQTSIALTGWSKILTNQKEATSLSSSLIFPSPLTSRQTLLSERLEKSNLCVLLGPVCCLCKNYG